MLRILLYDIVFWTQSPLLLVLLFDHWTFLSIPNQA
jgi:hypothetical protein